MQDPAWPRRAPAGDSGDLLFGAVPAVGFDLTDATTLTNGIVILSYQTRATA